MMADLSKWPNADDLLDQALALPLAAREPFLRETARTDADLAAALAEVLGEAGRDDGFLEPGGALSGSLGTEIARALDLDEPRIEHLAPGTRFEHYEITGLLGRGGMGDVYRARDVRLAREVALKLLPSRFARDPERLLRFRREARVLAALSHPGIGAIYGLAESDGREALVLELVEGPTLAERIAAGPPLAIDEALAIGRRVAEALAAAHARGILHRDLKPANIKLAPDGAVKVLDFGLAKVLAPLPADAAGVDVTARWSHTLLGTAAYMSPEQARGEAVDERADIWAFGCVLFELLTGTRAFPGETPAEVLSCVVGQEPALGLLPTGVPPAIRRLIRRSLVKDRTGRLGHFDDVLLEFDDATSASALEPLPVGPVPGWRKALPFIAGLALGALAMAFALWPRHTPPAAPVASLAVLWPEGDVPSTSSQPSVAISPDGETIVYNARREGVVRLFRRRLRDLEPVAIPGTEGATGPFFSPDGRWLGFEDDGVLKRVPVAGGRPLVICQAPGAVTASWAPDDTIVFAGNRGRVLQRVAVSGGQPVPLTALDPRRRDTLHLLPEVLPDGRTVIFTIVGGTGHRVAALRTDTGAIRVLLPGTHGRYVASGHLAFWHKGSLWAVRFDPTRLETVGQPIPLQAGIEHTDNTVLHLAVSASGSLVYMPERTGNAVQQLAWTDRSGRRTEAAPRMHLVLVQRWSDEVRARIDQAK